MVLLFNTLKLAAVSKSEERLKSDWTTISFNSILEYVLEVIHAAKSAMQCHKTKIKYFLGIAKKFSRITFFLPLGFQAKKESTDWGGAEIIKSYSYAGTTRIRFKGYISGCRRPLGIQMVAVN